MPVTSVAVARPGTDPATGLLDATALEEAGRRELARLSRYGHPVTMTLVHVHGIHDLNRAPAIARVGDAFRAALRSTDLVGRLGAELFAWVLPNTGGMTARLLADDVRAALGADSTVCASFGVAQAYMDEPWHMWMQRTQAALYRAKGAGGNAVVVDREHEHASDPDSVATGFLQIVWRQAFASGHALIDDQHCGLFALANEALGYLTAGAAHADLLRLLQALRHDCEQHFVDEEALLANVAYPGLERHARIHARLAARMDKLVDQCVEGRLMPADVIGFVTHDVIARHMLFEDRHHFPYLREVAANLGDASA